VSCAKTAEPIEMQIGMLSQVDSVIYVLHGDVDAPTGRGTFRRVWPI